jgi:hypothetical protein
MTRLRVVLLVSALVTSSCSSGPTLVIPMDVDWDGNLSQPVLRENVHLELVR